MKIVAGAVVGSLFACVAMALAAQEAGKPGTPADQYQALAKEFSAASRIIWQETTDEELNAVVILQSMK